LDDFEVIQSQIIEKESDEPEIMNDVQDDVEIYSNVYAN